MIKLSRASIPWRSSTPLSERHAGIFLGGCDNRTILAKHVTSFAPVAQHHLFDEKVIPLDIVMERHFPWQYRWIFSGGEDSSMSFPISDGSIKFVSTFEYRHYLSKVGEGESHHLVANELRKDDGHKDWFSAISERTNSFSEDRFLNRQNGIGSLYLEVSPSPLLIQRPKQTLKEKLCTEHLSVTP